MKADGTLNDRRVALALARMESAIKHRGRARVIQKIRQAGIDGDTAEDGVREVFEEVDEGALLDRALERRLRGKTPKELDDKGRARIVRPGAGLPLDAIFKKLEPEFPAGPSRQASLPRQVVPFPGSALTIERCIPGKFAVLS